MQVVKGDKIIFESGNTASARSEDCVVNDVYRVGSGEYPAFIRAAVVNVRNDIVGSSVAGRAQVDSIASAVLDNAVLYDAVGAFEKDSTFVFMWKQVVVHHYIVRNEARSDPIDDDSLTGAVGVDCRSKYT